MWLVVDSNQAGLIPSTLRNGRLIDRAQGLTLPLYTLAEILRRGQHKRRETLNLLQRHKVRIGLEPSQVFRWAGRLTPNQIASYEPFPPIDSELEVEYARLLDEIKTTVSPEARDWLASRRADADEFATRLRTQSKEMRALIRDNHIEKLKTVEEMLAAMADGPDSYVGKLVLVDVFTTASFSNREQIYWLAMRNPYLRSFFQATAYYLVSISKGWKDQRRNDVQLHRDVDRNDWIDLVLALYVGQGDCVISDDKLHKAIFTDFGVPIVRASDL